MLDEACARLAGDAVLVRNAPPKNSDRLFSNNFVVLGEGRGGGRVARSSLYGGPVGEESGHPTRRIKLLVRSETPRYSCFLEVDGRHFHVRTPGDGRQGELPRTLAFFTAMLLHEIPGRQMGEVSLAGGTIVQMKEGLVAATNPKEARAGFWEAAARGGGLN
jgi:hypothetical protein